MIVIVYTASPIFKNPQLEPDDYRYLEQVQQLKQDFFVNISTASVIENKWDHLWWINVHEKVHFLRPIVVMSYWIDDTMYGSNNPLGLLSTNILIYTVCVFLVCLILYSWIGPGISFFVSSVLFAAFFAHGEVMWYVAGRTDSLAALFLLGGLTLHIYGKQHPTMRWWAVPFFVLSLFTKEFTVILPLILFFNDLWIEKRAINFRNLLRQEWKIYSAFAIISVCFFAIRAWILSVPDTGYPYPYFVTLGNPNFSSHLLGQVNCYCTNLLFAANTAPFKIWTDFQNSQSLMGILPGIGIFCMCSFLLFREKKYWIFVLVGLGSWLPTIIVYQSERYLFLPSFAVVGIIGLLLLQLRKRSWILHYAALLICIVWIGHQAYSLQVKNNNISGNPRLPERIGKQLNEIKSSIAKGSKLLLLNLPGDIIQDQFTEAQFRIQLNDPNLDVVIMTPMPEFSDMGANLIVTRENENTILLQGTPIMEHGEDQFPWVRLDTASNYGTKSGIKIEILNSEEEFCTSIRFVLPDSLKEYILLKWNPASAMIKLSPSTVSIRSSYDRSLNSTVQIITP